MDDGGGNGLRVLSALLQCPLVNVNYIGRVLDVWFPTANRLARNERIINPESWASASDLKLAYVARGVTAVFAVAALASVAAGLEARWIALAAGVCLIGLIGLSQFAEDGGGFLATTRGKSSRALAIAYAVALIAFAAIVLVRI